MTATEAIRATRGRVFRAEFTKADGSRRSILARTGVHKYVTGEGLKFSAAERRLHVVYDLQAKGYRMIPVDRLISLTSGKVAWRVDAWRAAGAQAAGCLGS